MSTNNASNIPTGTSNTILQGQGAGASLALSTATYPATTTINQFLYSSAANAVTGLATANNGVLITSAAGVPSVLAAGTTGQVLTATTSNPATWVTPFQNSLSVHNIGFSYSAGTFTVHSQDGTALSASNTARITLPDRVNFGYSKTYTVSANQTFIDDAGASQIIGNRFGMTTGVAVNVDVPFFLYACSNDAQDTITFGISRIPHMQVAPVVGLLGTPTSAVADEQYSMFLFSSVTVAEYDENPVMCIGSFRMTMSASDDWTVQALDSQDGVGRFNQNRIFTGMAGQFGANSGTYSRPNGGTAAVFGENNQRYYIQPDGTCYLGTGLRLDGGTDGSGAVDALTTIPLRPSNLLLSNGGQFGMAMLYVNGGSSILACVNPNQSTNYCKLFIMGGAINDTYKWSNFGNGNRQIAYTIYYRTANS